MFFAYLEVYGSAPDLKGSASDDFPSKEEATILTGTYASR